jgi:hypothetical protein
MGYAVRAADDAAPARAAENAPIVAEARLQHGARRSRGREAGATRATAQTRERCRP